VVSGNMKFENSFDVTPTNKLFTVILYHFSLVLAPFYPLHGLRIFSCTGLVQVVLRGFENF